MRWKIPDKEYMDFLRNAYDSRIPNTDYGNSTFKPFFGELFSIGEIVYLTQVSHPQPRHKKLKNNMDFVKIYHPSRKSELMTIINLNYMFPIHRSLVIDLDYAKIDQYVSFSSDDARMKRVSFLSMQLREINKLPHLLRWGILILQEKDFSRTILAPARADVPSVCCIAKFKTHGRDVRASGGIKLNYSKTRTAIRNR